MKVRLTRQRMAAAVATAGLATTAALPGALAPSQAAPPEQAAGACPEAFPASELAPDQPVTGLTVAKGTTPDGFTGTVLGVIEDGIGADLDMIMVRLTSTEIDKAGIWAGMSGSPVYAADGRLIGAVSYGLAFGPSPVAGVTPAADMQNLLSSPPAAGSAATKVEVPESIERKLVRGGDATAAEAEEGLSRLPIPLGISGVSSSKRLAQINKRLKLDGVKAYRAGVAPAAPSEEEIVAGGNLAGSMSYGDLSAVGTGTATMVCGDEVVGFGHPFNWGGQSTMTMHGATALYIQEDPTVPGFKVSNPSGPVGVIDQDRLAGIKGKVGAAPETTVVTTKVTLPSGKTRTGTTQVSVPGFLPDAVAFALLNNEDRVFDKIGAGSATVHFTINGRTKGGKPFAVVRSNLFDSPVDISFETIFEAADATFMLLENEFTDATITSVSSEVRISDQRRNRTAQQVEIRSGGKWVKLKPSTVIKARPGSTIAIRTKLTAYRNQSAAKYLSQSFTVPKRTKAGTFGQLALAPATGSDEEEEPSGPKSFSALLKALATAPSNDQLQTGLSLSPEEGAGYQKVLTANVGDVVFGSHNFDVRIIK